MSNQGTDTLLQLVEAMEKGDITKVPADLVSTMKALQNAGVKSISDDFIFNVAEDKLQELMKAIESDDLILERIPEDKLSRKEHVSKGTCNVFIRHDGCDDLFEDNKLIAEPNLSAAVSAIMRRRS
jgi:hypothetical protein